MLVALVASAFAQDLDASGALPAPGDGSPDSPSFTPDPSPGRAGEWLVGAAFAYADATFYRYPCDPDCAPEPERVLGGLAVTNLAAGVGFTNFLGLSIQVPVFLATNGDASPTLGDLRLAFPITAHASEKSHLGFVPGATLPSGAGARFLGESRVVPTLDVVASAGLGPVALGGDLGARWGAPALDHGAGLDVLGAASARLVLAEAFAIGPEVRGLHSSAKDVRGDVAEAGVSLRGRAGQVAWTAGAMHGLSSGVGTAQWRAFAGLSWAPQQKSDDVRATPPVDVFALDPRGIPVRGATVRAGDAALGTTDLNGHFSVLAGTRWRDGVWVEVPGLAAAEVPRPTDGEHRVDLALRWAAVRVVAEVVDASGNPIPSAEIRLTGEFDPGAPLVTGDRYVWTVPPGSYAFEASGPGFGAQRRHLVVAPGRATPIVLESVLYPIEGDARLAVHAVDPEGGAAEDAVVTLDGRLFGTTSFDGLVEIDGLAPGKHDLKILSDHLQSTSTRSVTATKDATPIDLPLDWRDGTVRVIALGPEGQAQDAVVAFRGPADLTPSPLGEDGKRDFVLGPGTWQVLVSSPTLGLQVREVAVAAVTGPPIEVVVHLQPDGTGEGDLLVKVISADGEPVEGAEITVDGLVYGRTANQGDLLLSHLETGEHALDVRGLAHAYAANLHPNIRPGFQDLLVPLHFEPGTLEIWAHTVSGEPVDAQVRLSGPSVIAPLQLGPRGFTSVVVAPGEWSMLASSAKHGLQSRDVVVDASGERRRVEFVLNDVAKADAALHVIVTGPNDEPIDGASVLFAKTELGTTSTGGTLTANGLPATSGAVTVTAPGLSPATLPTIRLASRGTTTQVVKLAWAPGATRVVVTGPEGKVTDAVVRAASDRGVLAPRTVDEDGTLVLALEPGSWQILVSSSRLGLVQRDLVVPADATGLREEAFVFAPQEAATADLLVRVFDDAHHPVPFATVTIAGKEVGTTSAGGSTMIAGLQPGRVGAIVSAPYMESAVFDLVLDEGAPVTEFVTLDWQPVVASVATRDAAGQPISALISASSRDSKKVTGHTGGDGLGTVELRPGWWTIFVEAPGYGVRRTDLVLAPGLAPRDVTFTLSAARTDRNDEVLRILDKVSFELDQTAIGDDGSGALAEIATLMLAHPEITRLEVQGHSDASGTPAYNMELSQSRADTVREALIKLGVPMERLSARGYGAMRPVAENETDPGRAQNRRVEFVVRELASEP